MFARALYATVFFADGTTPPDAGLIETLNATWGTQRSTVATARFRARAFRTGDVGALSEEQVDAVLSQSTLWRGQTSSPVARQS